LPDEARLLGAVLVSLFAAWILTPLAIRVAARTAFYDHPVGYKAHPAPTAYLGGAAVLLAFLLAVAPFGGGLGHFGPIVACAMALSALGTLDDRVPVPPVYRVLAELGAAVVLWATGLGWGFLASGFEELVLTSLWIVAFTNAFNLMDNMDGAAGTVAAVCSAGIAGLAVVEGSPVLAAFCLSISGACLGFLRYNLRAGSPARIFLGDGGSIPLGFLVAAAAMEIPVDGPGLGWPTLLVGGLLLGLPVLDTLLVMVSRTRRGVALATGGRDHLTHRLQTRLGSARAVAVALAVVQAAVSVLATAALELGRTAIVVSALGCLALAAVVIAVLEAPAWATAHQSPRPASYAGHSD
jgi:UDP-GlcNAc:undecaprenyl-phosphate/decaprenyl-phosphate GlcNAc-1-phosphate transferase